MSQGEPSMWQGAHRVVIVGGGFGGLYAAKSLRGLPFDVTLLDRRNYHLFQPLLYQVATGGLSPANIAAPLRSVFRRQRNCRVLLGEVVDFDLANNGLVLACGRLEYDSLIVAAGMRHNYFGHPEWERHAPGLKTLADATEIRRRILLAFERAERETNPDERRALLTFVVIGGGPTGVELAGTLAEIAHHTLRREFRTIDPADAAIILLDGADRLLPPLAPELSASAQRQLERLGATVRCGAMVTNIDASCVQFRADGKDDRIESRTVLWGAGVQASPLGRKLAVACGVETDRIGRLPIEPDCSIAGHPDIFVIGDLAAGKNEDGSPLPGVAPVAMQQGAYVARVLAARRRGKTLPPFRYRNRGIMATIGRAAAVADIKGWRFSGYLAWLAWLFLHLFFLIEFQNRVLVMMQWAWNYLTWNRSARLIVDYSESESQP
jgi:NADH dehydrogenase